MSKESATNIYTMNKKKQMTNNHQLIQYFDLGLHNDGFWNYDHMDLQNEDVFDVLTTKYPSYDFVFIMDQSSGGR